MALKSLASIIKDDVVKDNVFPGDVLFELKATHGLPLDVAIEQIFNRGIVIDWVGFIEAARKNNWWDFQTYDVILDALRDALCDNELIDGIKLRFQMYVMNNPHPKMI